MIAYARVVTIDAEELRLMIRSEIEAALRQRPAVAAAPPPPTHEELIKVPRAARRFGVSPDTIRAWIHEGRLPRRKDGRHFLVSPAEIDRLVRELASADQPIDIASRADAILRRRK